MTKIEQGCSKRTRSNNTNPILQKDERCHNPNKQETQ